MTKRSGIIIGLIVILLIYAVSAYNGLVQQQEAVSQSWGQVQAVYQRRLDLIPNLVNTVKGYAAHEKDTLLAVTNARRMASSNLSGNTINSPAAFKKFTASQAALGQALGKLMVVVERYPNLKASENFLALQTQLEGTENRIAVARERYNNAAKTYNTAIRQFPRNIIAGMSSHFKAKAYFSASAHADTAPTVNF